MAEQEEYVEMGASIVVFDVKEAAIAERRERYMKLTIQGLDDKAGLDTVHAARIDIKGLRISVMKTGKAYRDKINVYLKKELADEKHLLGLLSPIEDYLKDEESRIEEEKARIKAEAEAQETARIQIRVNRLFDLGCRFDGTSYIYGNLNAPYALVKVASDEQFETFCGAIQGLIDEENAAKAAEAERLAQIQKEQARVAAEQEKERQRLAAEAKAIQDEKDRLAREAKAVEDAKLKEEQAKIRIAEMEKAKAEAAEKARIETEERIKREAAEKEARIKADADEKARKEEAARIRSEKKEARRPDKDKLFLYVSNMFSTPGPELKTEEGKAVWEGMQITFEDFHADLLVLLEVL